MRNLHHVLRHLVDGLQVLCTRGRQSRTGSQYDWLPPVLGPNDWSIGVMADRSASWYFERD